MSCPVASPLAWSPQTAYSCNGGRLRAQLPANDGVFVRPPGRGGVAGAAEQVASPRLDPARERWGAAPSCPLAAPLASCSRLRHHLVVPPLLPTNEGGKRSQRGCPLAADAALSRPRFGGGS